MTINDIDVNALCLLIREKADSLSMLMREGKELALFMALSDIDRAAKQAQYRLNDIQREASSRKP